jgi:KaiC/GvpD/RAD55 family RecA-like ATPase
MSWAPRNLALEPAAPPIQPEIGDVLYRSLRHLVSGEPETLKGWLLLVLALLELRAGEHVLWVDFEQGPAMTLERLRALGATDDEIERFLYLEPREPLNDETRRMIAELVEEKRPTLVVFDAYAGLLGLEDGDPNSERDIERVNRRVVDLLAGAGAASVIIDHPVKAVAERGRYSSGSGRKLAEADVHIRLDRGQAFARGRIGTAHLVVLKDRPGALPRPKIGTLALTSDPYSGAITWELRPPELVDADQQWQPTALMEKVSLYLERQAEPVSRSAIARDVIGKRDYLWAAVDHLIAGGYAAETPGPRGARLIESVRPYQDDPSPVPDPSPPVSENRSQHPSPVPLSLSGDRDGSGYDDDWRDDDIPF